MACQPNSIAAGAALAMRSGSDVKNGPRVVNRSLVTTPSLTNGSSHQNGLRRVVDPEDGHDLGLGGEPGGDPALHGEAIAESQPELVGDVLADGDRDGRPGHAGRDPASLPATRVA